jgi:thiol-disulfide isomerase/thioredoxin
MDWIAAMVRYTQPLAIAVMLAMSAVIYLMGRGNRHHLPRGCLGWLVSCLALLVFLCGGAALVGYSLFGLAEVRTTYDELEAFHGRPAPPLQIELMPDRAPASLADYRGQVLLLNFWGTWCGPCKEEMPALDALQRELGGRGLVVLHVSEEDPDSILRYLDQHPMKTRHARVADLGRADRPYPLAQDNLPLTFLIDRAGQLRASVLGNRSREFYRAAIRELL